MSKVCPKCNNKRHIFVEGKGWVRCVCIDQIRADNLMRKSGFPDSLWEVEATSFKPGDNPERIRLAQYISTASRAYNKQHIFIYSDTPEKDRAAAIICRFTAIYNKSVGSISYVTIDQLVQNKFNKYSYVNSSFETDPNTADITVVSIGREMTNDAHRSNLYSFIYERILAEKFVIIISSIPRDRIVHVYRQAINTLLERNFLFYSC